MTGRFGGNSDVGRSWTSVSKYDGEDPYSQYRDSDKPGKFARGVQATGLVLGGMGATSLRNSFTLDSHMKNSYSAQKQRADAAAARLQNANEDLDAATKKLRGATPRSRSNPLRFVSPVKKPIPGGPVWHQRNGKRKAAQLRVDSLRESDIKERTKLAQFDEFRKPENVALKRKSMRISGGVAAAAGGAMVAAPYLKNRFMGEG